MTSAHHSALRPSLLRLTLILGSLTAFAPFATDMYLASFSELQESFHTDLTKVQLSLSLFFFGLAVGQLIYGTLIDRFGRKRPLQVGVLVFTVASLMLTVAPDIDSFIFLRLLQALGGCAGMIISRAIISDLFPPQEAARVLSQMMLVQGLAPIIAPILGGYIVSSMNWHAIFIFLTFFGVVCFMGATFGLPETLPRSHRQRESFGQILLTYLRLLAQPRFMVPTLSGAFAFAGIFAFISGSPYVYMELYGVSTQHYGWLFGFNAFGFIISSQINRFLLTRFQASRILFGAICLHLCASITLLLVLPYAPLPVIVGLLWLGLGTTPMIGANAVAIAMGASGEHRGSASAVIGVLQFTFASSVSAVLSFIHNGTAYPMVGLIFICGFLSGTVFLLGRRYL